MLWGRLTVGRHLRVAIAAGVGLLCAYRVGVWWVSPEHRIAQFIGAANRADYPAMLARADEPELQSEGMTPARLRDALTFATGLGPGAWKLAPGEYARIGPVQSRYNRVLVVRLADPRGAVLHGVDGRDMTGTLVAYNTDRGWKIGLTRLLASLAAARHWQRTRTPYRDLCARTGLRPRVFLPEDGRWIEAAVDQ